MGLSSTNKVCSASVHSGKRQYICLFIYAWNFHSSFTFKIFHFIKFLVTSPLPKNLVSLRYAIVKKKSCKKKKHVISISIPFIGPAIIMRKMFALKTRTCTIIVIVSSIILLFHKAKLPSIKN